MVDENKRAIVVGASRGIGLGLVRELLNHQWSVIATIRDENQCYSELNQLLSEYPNKLKLAELDLSNVQTAGNLISECHGNSIDLLLVSAGILGPEHQKVELCTPDEITDLFWVNSIAPVTIARRLLPLMKEKSVIAFMSSRMGSITLNDDGSMELYRASKAALNSLTRGFALNEAIPAQIGVLNLHPGWVQTEMGGNNASISVKESTTGIVRVIEGFLGQSEQKFVDFQDNKIEW